MGPQELQDGAGHQRTNQVIRELELSAPLPDFLRELEVAFTQSCQHNGTATRILDNGVQRASGCVNASMG